MAATVDRQAAVEVESPAEPNQSQNAPAEPSSTTQIGAPPPDTLAGFIFGFQLAHYDFCNWFYSSHGDLFDCQITKLDAASIRREVLGYGFVTLLAGLLLTGAAPFVANLLCILYPIISTWSILKGKQEETRRFLVFWSLFGVLSMADQSLGESSLYWMTKIVMSGWLSLPQTQGALVFYGLLIEPISQRLF